VNEVGGTCGSGQGPVAGSCEYGDEPAGSGATELVSYAFRNLSFSEKNSTDCKQLISVVKIKLNHKESNIWQRRSKEITNTQAKQNNLKTINHCLKTMPLLSTSESEKAERASLLADSHLMNLQAK
jgi:hypothetical protein